MLVTLSLLFGLLATSVTGSNEKRAVGKPNIVFIFTDDQDARMNSLQYMKSVQKNLVQQGASYQRHYCTVALCCPSRVNLLTGRMAHNTNITELKEPYGGYDKFAGKGKGATGNYNNDFLPLWMQQAGYNTYYVGKLMNGFTPDNYNDPYVNGYNGSDFLCGGATYNYYNPQYQRNVGNVHHAPHTYKMNYTTHLTRDKGLAFLDDARQSNRPFFLTMATVAPHNGNGPRPGNNFNFGPVPEEKYAKMFGNETQVPRTLNFNPDTPSGTSWLLKIAQLSNANVTRNDEYYRQRLRALQSVDDLVDATFTYLEKYNLLDNTYVIYSTDNGFHISQHRLFPGKNLPYEEDINIPLIIRGPGITPGSTVNVATTHSDMAPTILTMAGAPLPDYLDGSAVPMVAGNPVTQNFEHAQIEHWGDAGSDDEHNYKTPGVQNTTYKALRIMGDGYDYYYSVWCSNQHELYDMRPSADPYQMNNLFKPYSYKPGEPATGAGDSPYPINRLESRLDALLLVLKSCKADTCRKPWEALHPQGDVTNLNDAMAAKYDQFYEQQQNRVSFEMCRPGYEPDDAEGPQKFVTYKSQTSRREEFNVFN